MLLFLLKFLFRAFAALLGYTVTYTVLALYWLFIEMKPLPGPNPQVWRWVCIGGNDKIGMFREKATA